MNALVPVPAPPLEGEIVEGGFFLEPNPFKIGSLTFIAAETDGWTLQDYADCAAGELPPGYRDHIELWVDETRADRAYWRNVRPKPGHTVFARVRPRGKGGKNILRAVIMIAIVAAAIYFLGPASPIFAGGFGAAIGLGGFAASLATAFAIAAVTFVGQLALNALIPPPGLTGVDSDRDPRYKLTGSSNRFVPYGVVPRVYGKIRLYPMLAGHPWTENFSKKQYLRLLLVVGWGPLKISDIRIGNTPITAYQNVEYEVHEGGPSGWSGNINLSLYNRKVTETPLSIETIYNTPSVFQTTPANTVEISVDITFPYGLIEYDHDGDRDPQTVQHLVEYRAVGSGTWLNAPLINDIDDETTISGGTISVRGKSPEAITKTVRFKPAAGAGQYEVRLTRQSVAGGNPLPNGTVEVDRSYWTVLRSYSTDAPVNQTGVCLIAIRMKASDQLNGVPNQINCLVEAYLPTLSNPNVFALTRSPAVAYADVLRRRGGQTFLPDSRIDLSTLTAWDTDCNAAPPNGTDAVRWAFDGVIEGGTVFDALRQIAAIGRASYTMKDGKFSVVRDKSQATPVQVITPKNSWGYSGTRTFVDQPHALRVEFQNAAADYRVDERVVYADGYTEANATRFEVLQLFGATTADFAFREARYHLAVGTLRPEEHQVTMDIEGLRCTLGDRVQVAYDVMVVGLSQGRIKAVTATAGGSITTDEEITFEASKTYQVRYRLANGTQVVKTVTAPGGTPGTYTQAMGDFSANPPAVGDMFLFGETGLESAPMLVKKIEPADDLAVRLTLTNYDEAVYTADTGAIPAFNSYIASDVARTPPAPPGISVRADETVRIVTDGQSVINRLAVDIAPPASSRVPIEGYEIQYREVYSGSWINAGALWPTGTATVFCEPVRSGEAYQVRGRAKGTNGLYSDWVQPADITVIGISYVPDAPTSPTATPGYREIYVRWTNPLDADLKYVEVLANTTDNSGTATVVGRTMAQTFTHADLSPGVTYYYWLRAVDFAANVSPLTTVVSAAALSISLYEGIGSDSTLHPQEKLLIIREWNDLSNEKTYLETMATALGITTEKTDYTNAYNTLSSYLTGLSPAWDDTSQSTTIVRSTWNANWQDLYLKRQLLLNKIDERAAQEADWPSINDPDGTMPDDNATGGDNVQPDPVFDAGTGTTPGPNWNSDVPKTAIP